MPKVDVNISEKKVLELADEVLKVLPADKYEAFILRHIRLYCGESFDMTNISLVAGQKYRAQLRKAREA